MNLSHLSVLEQKHKNTKSKELAHSRPISILTSYPAMLSWMETSTGRFVTPAADWTNDIKRSGNQMMLMRAKMMTPPKPYFTTFFFFCPGGWGYFWKNYGNISVVLTNSYKSIFSVVGRIHLHYDFIYLKSQQTFHIISI